MFVSVAKSVKLIFPKTLQALGVDHVNQLLHVKLTFPILAISSDIVLLLQENVAVSCGNGILTLQVAVLRVVPAVHSVVVAVVNVIQEFHLQSQLHQVAEDKSHEQLPAQTISW